MHDFLSCLHMHVTSRIPIELVLVKTQIDSLFKRFLTFTLKYFLETTKVLVIKKQPSGTDYGRTGLTLATHRGYYPGLLIYWSSI